MSERQDLAEAHWGTPLPDWISVLVSACDQTSQGRVAKQLGLSGAVVSHLLRNSYAGDMARCQQAVRAALMNETIDCPALKTIALSECLGHRKAAREMSGSDPLSVIMLRACNRCPIYKGDTK